MRLAVLASGRGSNLQTLIDNWQEGQLHAEIITVGSDKPHAKALLRAQHYQIPTHTFARTEYKTRSEQEEAILVWLQEYEIDLLVLAGFMRLLSASFITAAQIPIVNIHPSLLPAFPGLNAQQQALDYGVKISGCTVHFVDEGLDTGPIIAQEAVPVKEWDTVEDLSNRILAVEHRLYPQVIHQIATGQVDYLKVAERRRTNAKSTH